RMRDPLEERLRHRRSAGACCGCPLRHDGRPAPGGTDYSPFGGPTAVTGVQAGGALAGNDSCDASSMTSSRSSAVAGRPPGPGPGALVLSARAAAVPVRFVCPAVRPATALATRAV